MVDGDADHPDYRDGVCVDKAEGAEADVLGSCHNEGSTCAIQSETMYSKRLVNFYHRSSHLIIVSMTPIAGLLPGAKDPCYT